MAATSIVIKNRVSELVRLSGATEAALRGAGVPTETLHAVNIALEEIVTNIIKYGFADRAEHDIEVRLDVAGTELAIRVVDEGRAFDPMALPPPDIAAPVEKREVGGLGVHLVRKLMDAVEYRREGNKNVLAMRKKFVPARS